MGYHNGAAIQLSDIADVQDSVENIRAAGFVNGQPSVLVVVSRQPGANIIQTVDSITAALPSLKASIPAGIDLTIVLDRTTTIRASVKDIERTLAISIALVILVVFVFLRTVRATLIPAVAVPVSLIGTFGAMHLFGEQPRQPLADGADSVDRLRRRRCGRGDREHHAPSRGGQASDGRRDRGRA